MVEPGAFKVRPVEAGGAQLAVPERGAREVAPAEIGAQEILPLDLRTAQFGQAKFHDPFRSQIADPNHAQLPFPNVRLK